MLTAFDSLFRKYLTTLLGIYVLVGLVVLIALAIAVVALIQAYAKYRGKRVITCPETHHHEAVELDAPLAAMSALLNGPKLHLSSCTRWPERQDCAQDCIREIELSPFGCQLRAVLDDWYKGKECVYCRRPLGEIQWFDHKPALQSPEGEIKEWETFRPEDIPDALATHQPVCWDCKIVEKFRAEHAELVTDRPWPHS